MISFPDSFGNNIDSAQSMNESSFLLSFTSELQKRRLNAKNEIIIFISTIFFVLIFSFFNRNFFHVVWEKEFMECWFGI
jgi:uncharacterized membrane protein YvbJ